MRRTGKKAFTLVEVLVVIAITSLLAGIVLTYSSKGRAQVTLYVESAKLSQVILRAKSLAIATFSSPDAPCGYGVHIDSAANKYSLFSYSPNDCYSIQNGPIDTADPGYSVLDSFDLPPSVVYGDSSNSLENAGDILFVPPDPKTMIWPRGGSFPSATAAKIVLTSPADNSYSLEIRISSAGQINY